MHYQDRRKQSVNADGYSLQAGHCQRFRRNAVPGQRGIGWQRLSSPAWLYACPGLNCMH